MLKYYQITVVVLLLLLLSVFYAPAFILGLVLPDQTIYASANVKEKWNMLRIGMSREEVIGLVGYPLEDAEYGPVEIYRITFFSDGVKSRECYPNIRKPPKEYNPEVIEYHWFRYSKPGKLVDDYNIRMVKIESNGKVAQVVASRYSD